MLLWAVWSLGGDRGVVGDDRSVGVGEMNFQYILFGMLVCGIIAAMIADRKNLPSGQWFIVGALLGVIGLFGVAIAKPGLPAAPAGMRAVCCPYCSAVQNVREEDAQYVCWRCHGTAQAWVTQ